MADYDSDSSGADDVQTNVLLGYASKETTSDEFSQLGGHPTWLDDNTPPSGALAKCKVCNGLMSLLLQLHADLPERYPSHVRRLYVWSCRRKVCRRKSGSIRAFRATRRTAAEGGQGILEDQTMSEPDASNRSTTATTSDPLGNALFGVNSTEPTNNVNPFAPPSASTATANPFASTSSVVAQPAQKPTTSETLAETFAQKARISAPSHPRDETPAPDTHEPWPESSGFPEPYPSYHLDADNEYLYAETQEVPKNARLDQSGTNGEGSGSAAEEKAAFESSMDRTFQRFADRLAHNPEQVLRYEFDGSLLLYSTSDAVGKLLAPTQNHGNAKVQVSSSSSALAKIPRCSNCGAARVFELQLTPHAITELEADELSIDGMDWGTIIVAVCSKDCQVGTVKEGAVGYSEEWVGVQWEELAEKRR